MGKNGSCTIQVYADDNLVYTKIVKQKTDLFKFSADINGAEYIQVVITGDKDHYPNSMILMDAMLWKE